MEINRERFEAWLFSQPLDRRFDYFQGYPSDKTGCLLCNFLRETISKRHRRIGVDSYSFNLEASEFELENEFQFPDWMKVLLPKDDPGRGYIFTAGYIQSRYRQLFPDFEAPVEQSDKPISFRGIQPR